MNVNVIKVRTYRVVIPSNWLICLQFPVFSKIPNLCHQLFTKYYMNHKVLMIFIDKFTELEKQWAYPFNEVTSIGICIKYFVGFHISFNLGCDLFPNSIVYWDRSNLNNISNTQKVVAEFSMDYQHQEKLAYSELNFCILLFSIHPSNLHSYCEKKKD